MHRPRVPGEAGTRRQHKSTLHRAALQPPGGGALALPFCWALLELGGMEGPRPVLLRGLLGPGAAAASLSQGQQICCAAVQVRFAGSGCFGSPTQCNLFITGLDPEQCWGCSGAAVVVQRCDRVLLLFSCRQPLASRSAHVFPRESPGNSWTEFSRRLARDKSFKVLAKEFETSPKFAENTY